MKALSPGIGHATLRPGLSDLTSTTANLLSRNARVIASAGGFK
jgi:hypothetical protein